MSMTEQKKNTEPKPNLLKKLFYGLNLTWPKLIIASVAIGVFVGVLMCIPPLKDTSFTRIGVIMYWWVLFGTIIITNSKTNLESALKCFVFFLISQPVIYLVQVPFSVSGWGLFAFYKYWFMWTLATLPMGFIGHWLIARKDIWSALILAPAVMIVLYEGFGEFGAAFAHFPQYLLSGCFCLAIATIIILGVLEPWKLRSIAIAVSIIATIIFIFATIAKPEDHMMGLSFAGADYGVNTDKEWHIESEFGERLRIKKEPVYGEDDQETGEYIYTIFFNGNGNDFGSHEFKIISEDETKSCQLTIDKTSSSLSCE